MKNKNTLFFSAALITLLFVGAGCDKEPEDLSQQNTNAAPSIAAPAPVEEDAEINIAMARLIDDDPDACQHEFVTTALDEEYDSDEPADRIEKSLEELFSIGEENYESEEGDDDLYNALADNDLSIDEVNTENPALFMITLSGEFNTDNECDAMRAKEQISRTISQATTSPFEVYQNDTLIISGNAQQ